MPTAAASPIVSAPPPPPESLVAPATPRDRSCTTCWNVGRFCHSIGAIPAMIDWNRISSSAGTRCHASTVALPELLLQRVDGRAQ